VNDAGQFRLAGPVTVLCSARTVGAACTLMRHLHTAGATVLATRSERSGAGTVSPQALEADHLEPHAGRLLLPALEIRRLLRIELNLQ